MIVAGGSRSELQRIRRVTRLDWTITGATQQHQGTP